MSKITVATATTTRPLVAVATDKVAGPRLLEAVFGGTVRFSKERASGTARHWPVLAPGTAQREQAEAIEAARAAKKPVEAIAKDLKVSVPTVRRSITALAFTRELEKMTAKDRAALAKDLSANVQAPEQKAPKAEKSTKPDTKTVTARKVGEPKDAAKPVANTTKAARKSEKTA